MTLTDEGTIDNGVAKRRQQKIYSDVLGRTVKTEILNWQGGSVYAATVNAYNARDQVTLTRQYAGAEGSGTYQDTTMTHDGYGRLKTRHVPEQNAGANSTWDYNPDGTIQKLTDGRGAAATFSYNQRHLVTGITYSVLSGSQIPVPGAISFTYDANSNRTGMTDDTGSTSYAYDSLSRLTSESRSFTGLSGTYALNYSYNLANAMTTLAIPFRSQQIGYNYDSAARLSGVTATGFSATQYVWPNQYTQNLTSFASNITYRAWDGVKGMAYGNTTSEQTTYNARMQPDTHTLSNMNYQNTNICCSYPTYSTMTWTYGYYDDGSLKHAWDSTNEWFDRAYKYDHVGRLKEASTFRRARGLSPYPSINYPDPYYQSITYDAFNHSSRSGSLYTGAPPSDNGSYVNNRRTDFGWEYDADGNNTRDAEYQQTFNAAGALVRSVSHAMVGDGIQYPLEPRLDITQTYDGNGRPAKRDQISRQPGIFDEFGNQSEPIEDTKTTYHVNSSVLGGATVVELGWGDQVHIYAGGQRIAREMWGSVTFEHHNPVTGNWVTSHGHSSYRTTGREERDPRGAEMPLSNPYGAAQSYVDWKFSQPLFIEGGDPFDYSSGREIDGLPVSETEFQRRTGNGSAGAGVFVGGKFAQFVNLSRHTSVTHLSVTFDVYRSWDKTPTPDVWIYMGRFTREFELNRQSRSTETSYQRKRRDTPKHGVSQNRPFSGDQLKVFETAYELARAALFSNECAQEITGNGGRMAGQHAAFVLSSILHAKNFRAAGPSPGTKSGLPLFASTHNAGDGGKAVINIYEEFFDSDYFNFRAASAGATTSDGEGYAIAGIPRISPTVVMALTTLHELRHAITGKTHKGESDKERNAWDARIFKACFPELAN